MKKVADCASIIRNVNPNILDLEPYPPGKPLDELKREYGIQEAIKLASNENPFGPSPEAVEAIKEAASGVSRYPDGSSYYLKARLSALWGVGQENIVLGNGSNEVIQFLIHAFTGPGTEVISSDPSFLMYRKMVQIFGATNRLIPLRDNGHDLWAILDVVRDSTRIIFLDNPHNPMGTVIKREEFEEFLDKLPDHVIVCLDEAYGEFVRDEEGVRGRDYIERDPRVVFLRTFSKAYGLSGLRVGYGVMASEIAQVLERVRQPFNINALAQAGALAALDDRAHLEGTVKQTWTGLDWYYERLKKLGLDYIESNTNFVFVKLGVDARVIYEEMLKKGVIIRAMGAYGHPQAVRITVGTREENERCMKALEEALSEVNGR